MNDLSPVSAVILTYNEELNIEACLKSVAGWCEEIFVVDSGSTDKTQEIVKRYSDLFFVHRYIDHASQWNWAFTNLPLGCEWLLLLDADNIVSDNLKRQIDAAIKNDKPEVDGYFSFHDHYFRGKRVRGLKSYWLRLVRHRNTRIDASELVDFRMILKGKTEILSGEIVEYNRKEDEIDFWIDKHQKFASRMAIEEVLRVEGLVKWSTFLRPNLLGNPDERMLWFKNYWYSLPLYVRPPIFFLYRYILRGGFLDGSTGFIYHFLQAFWFRMIVDMKIAELRQRVSRGELSMTQLYELFAHKH
jgi:glycosyltransferase involved in cell wall biosynthesis